MNKWFSHKLVLGKDMQIRVRTVENWGNNVSGYCGNIAYKLTSHYPMNVF